MAEKKKRFSWFCFPWYLFFHSFLSFSEFLSYSCCYVTQERKQDIKIKIIFFFIIFLFSVPFLKFFSYFSFCFHDRVSIVLLILTIYGLVSNDSLYYHITLSQVYYNLLLLSISSIFASAINLSTKVYLLSDVFEGLFGSNSQCLG